MTENVSNELDLSVTDTLPSFSSKVNLGGLTVSYSKVNFKIFNANQYQNLYNKY